MTDLPDPLVPAEVDLQDFPFMPLQVARLRDSDLAAEGDPEANWYAVLLWAASWHQLPAGSLPDNDTVLMRIVGLGRDSKTWKKHRDGALRGFVLCSDGRLYHPIVAEQANSAWESKLRQRHRTFGATIRQHNLRHPEEKRENPPFEEWLSHGQPQTVTELDAALSRATGGGVTRDNPPSHAPVTRYSAPRDSIRDRDRDILSNQPTIQESSEVSGELRRVLAAAGFAPTGPKLEAAASELAGWLEEKFDLELDILPAIERTVAERDGVTNSLRRFTAPIRSAHRHRTAAEASRPAPTPLHDTDPRIAVLQRDEPEVIATIRERLRASLGSVYARHMAPTACRIEDDWCFVTTPSPFASGWLAENVGPALSRHLEELTGRRHHVRFDEVDAQPRRAASA